MYPQQPVPNPYPQQQPMPAQNPYPQQQMPAYPPQQQMPAYAPAMPAYPPQGYGYPVMPAYPPQQQMPALPSGNLDDFYTAPSNAGAAWKFKDKPIGTWYEGVVARGVTDADVRPQTDQAGRPVTFKDGRQKWVLVVPMSFAPTSEYPDGVAGWWVKGQARDELARAMAEAGAPAGTPQQGASIRVTLTGTRPVPNMNPAYVYRIEYAQPGVALAPPQQVMQQGIVPGQYMQPAQYQQVPQQYQYAAQPQFAAPQPQYAPQPAQYAPQQQQMPTVAPQYMGVQPTGQNVAPVQAQQMPAQQMPTQQVTRPLNMTAEQAELWAKLGGQ